MNRFFRYVRFGVAACLLAACTPARTGVIGNTLTTNIKPHISITAQGQLHVLAHGKITPYAETDRMGAKAGVSFDYALFADDNATASPEAPCFAYAAIVRLAQPNMWRFHPPVPAQNVLFSGSTTMDGIVFLHQVLHIPSHNDWASDVWTVNGQQSPTCWIIKRWTAHLGDDARAIMEYREPWKGEAPVSASIGAMGNNAGETLQAFVSRADAAFSVNRKGGDFSVGNTPPASKLALPEKDPDIARLFGAIAATGNDN